MSAKKEEVISSNDSVKERMVVVMMNNRTAIISSKDIDKEIHFHQSNRPFTEEELAILGVK